MIPHDEKLGAAIVAAVDEALKRGVGFDQISMALIGFGVGSLMASGYPTEVIQQACSRLIEQGAKEFVKQGGDQPPS